VAIDAASSDRGSKPRRTACEARRPDTRAARGRAKAGRSYSITSSARAEQRRRHLDAERPRRLQVDDGAQRACVFNGLPTQTRKQSLRPS
jgi:hypothetical protein